ncbi:hypothetical protein TruAng_010988 [Truncatella angustata]|nr:hypothetical protein TruAng_010988 [Truncatella angustata]
MAAFIAKKISSKILGESLENKWGAKILNKVKRRAYKLDLSLFSIAGIRFGWSSVIGLVPFAGDAVDFFMAVMVINSAKKVDGGLPSGLVLKMWFWACLDLVIGLIPFLGDVFDAIIKANCRNAIYLEEHLRKQGQQNLRRSGLPIPEIDPSDPDEFDRLQEGPENRRSGRRAQESGVDSAPAMPPRPTEARVRDDRRAGGGWFGRSRRADEESGVATQPPTRKSTRRG